MRIRAFASKETAESSTLPCKRVVYFLHIRKTGGTAIKYALKNQVSPRYVINLHGHSCGLKDVPRGEGVFFFVRDPVARFVSGFYSRQRQGQPRYSSPWRPGEERAFSYFKTPNELAVGLTSVGEQRNRALEAMENISHLNSHYWDWFDNEEYFKTRLPDILFIGFQETLDEDFERLKLKLDLPDAKLPTDDANAHRRPRGQDLALDKNAIDNLKSWYRQDYEFVDLSRRIVSGASNR